MDKIAKIKTDEIAKINALIQEYQALKKYMDGSYRYLEKIYENSIILPLQIFEKGFNALNARSKKKKDNVKRHFMRTKTAINKYVRSVMECQDSINEAIKDGLDVENRNLSRVLEDSDYRVNENIQVWRVLDVFKKMSACTGDYYQKADTELSEFCERYLALKLFKNSKNESINRMLINIYGCMDKKLRNEFCKEHDVNQRVIINEFGEKMKKLIGTNEMENCDYRTCRDEPDKCKVCEKFGLCDYASYHESICGFDFCNSYTPFKNEEKCNGCKELDYCKFYGKYLKWACNGIYEYPKPGPEHYRD